MIGLEYICNLHGVQYKDIAEMIGRSKQTVSTWISGAGKIPKKYVSVFSQRFKIPEMYFQKELSKNDEIEIQKMRLNNDLKDIQHKNDVIVTSIGKTKSTNSRDNGKRIINSCKFETDDVLFGIKEKQKIKSKCIPIKSDVSEVLELFQMFTDLLSDEKVNKDTLRKLLLATKE